MFFLRLLLSQCVSHTHWLGTRPLLPHLYVKKILMDLSHFEAWDSDASFRFFNEHDHFLQDKAKEAGEGEEEEVCLPDR